MDVDQPFESLSEDYRLLLQGVIDSRADGVLILSPSQQIILANRVAETIWASPPQELLGQSLHGLLANVNQLQADQFSTLFSQAQSKSSLTALQHLECKTQKNVIFELSVVLLPHPFHERSLFLATLKPIYKIVDDQRDHAYQTIIRSTDLASIGLLSAGVSHEVNNPLAIIHGFMEIIKERLELLDIFDSDFQEAINAQSKAIKRIQIIVDHLRIFAKVDALKTSRIDLHDLIQDSIKILRSMCEKHNILVIQDLYPHRLFIEANQAGVQQIMLNLLSNALDAITEKQEIEVAEITIKSDYAAGKIDIRVTDTGVGIPQEKLTTIFEPFYTTKAPGKGTGLGLSVSHTLIQEMGGCITIHTAKNQGTTFHITVPGEVDT